MRAERLPPQAPLLKWSPPMRPICADAGEMAARATAAAHHMAAAPTAAHTATSAAKGAAAPRAGPCRWCSSGQTLGLPWRGAESPQAKPHRSQEQLSSLRTASEISFRRSFAPPARTRLRAACFSRKNAGLRPLFRQGKSPPGDTLGEAFTHQYFVAPLSSPLQTHDKVIMESANRWRPIAPR
jgi:hypothetical protein